MYTEDQMAAMIAAMRRGRSSLLQGQQGFLTGGAQDLSSLMSRQGLNQQPGLDAAMEKYRGRLGEEQALQNNEFDRGLQGMQSEQDLGRATELQNAATQMQQQGYKGQLMEGQLRQSLFRMRQNQQQQALLSGLGTLLGLAL